MRTMQKLGKILPTTSNVMYANYKGMTMLIPNMMVINSKL